MTNKYETRQSSCYFLDIRNSTNIIRTISLKSDKTRGSQSENTADAKKIIVHAEFMLDIHTFLFEKLKKLDINDYYFNNTGDGHVCMIWNKTHAWTILNIICSICSYLEKRIKEYYENHLKQWEEEYHKQLSIGYGIGMHTGECVLSEEKITNSKFAYGIVLNTAARTESFTKSFPKIDFIFTKFFKSRLESQFKLLKPQLKNKWKDYEKLITAVSEFPIDTKDGKSKGHLLYTIDKKNRRYFIHNYET